MLIIVVCWMFHYVIFQDKSLLQLKALLQIVRLIVFASARPRPIILGYRQLPKEIYEQQFARKSIISQKPLKLEGG